MLKIDLYKLLYPKRYEQDVKEGMRKGMLAAQAIIDARTQGFAKGIKEGKRLEREKIRAELELQERIKNYPY